MINKTLTPANIAPITISLSPLGKSMLGITPRSNFTTSTSNILTMPLAISAESTQGTSAA